MKKRILTVLAVWLAVTLCSCGFTKMLPQTETAETQGESLSHFMQIVPDVESGTEGYEPVTSLWAYNTLPLEGEKVLYNKLLDVIYDIAPEKDEDTDRYAMPQIETQGYSLSEAQVRTAVKALTDDHPEIFWATGTIGYYSDESTTVIQVYSSYSPEQVDTRVNAVHTAANEFYATVPNGLSAFEREIMVHDYLIEHVSYDENVDTINFDNNNPDIYTVYGTLVNGVAVCEGYARAFQMLMNGLGVDCVGLMGHSQNQLHMWNAARLDGVWYQVDVTWDDQEASYARHIFCNVSDSFMEDDHTLSPLFTALSDDEINGESGDCDASVMNLFVPECPDSTMGYYYQKAPHLSDYDGEEVISGLYDCAVKQDEFFIFYIDESLDFTTAVDLLFADYPQYFFDYMNAVNNLLTDYSIDSSNAGYFMHEKSRIVAVEMHYY